MAFLSCLGVLSTVLVLYNGTRTLMVYTGLTGTGTGTVLVQYSCTSLLVDPVCEFCMDHTGIYRTSTPIEYGGQ